VGIKAAGRLASFILTENTRRMTPHLKSDVPFKKQDFLLLPKMKMFVPLFVGLYASHISFRVLETLWVYKVARIRKRLFYDFWKNSLV